MSTLESMVSSYLLYGAHANQLSGHVWVLHSLLQCQLAQAHSLVPAALGSIAAGLLQLLRGWVPVIRPLHAFLTPHSTPFMSLVAMLAMRHSTHDRAASKYGGDQQWPLFEAIS